MKFLFKIIKIKLIIIKFIGDFILNLWKNIKQLNFLNLANFYLKFPNFFINFTNILLNLKLYI